MDSNQRNFTFNILCVGICTAFVVQIVKLSDSRVFDVKGKRLPGPASHLSTSKNFVNTILKAFAKKKASTVRTIINNHIHKISFLY